MCSPTTPPFDVQTESPFPPVDQANSDGLLAMGGELDSHLLIAAYRHGIFPWNNPGQPVLWWAPDPRTVLWLKHFRISRSFRKTLKSQRYRVTIDQDFAAVIDACAHPDVRRYTDGTWITHNMRDAYCQLHQDGYAHSVECWHDDELCGGLYGVSLGNMFFGESMFSRRSDSSKVALAWLIRQLTQWQFELIDCQLPSEHLFSLGAQEMPREEFMHQLSQALTHADKLGPWQLDTQLAGGW